MACWCWVRQGRRGAYQAAQGCAAPALVVYCRQYIHTLYCIVVKCGVCAAGALSQSESGPILRTMWRRSPSAWHLMCSVHTAGCCGVCCVWWANPNVVCVVCLHWFRQVALLSWRGIPGLGLWRVEACVPSGAVASGPHAFMPMLLVVQAFEVWIHTQGWHGCNGMCTCAGLHEVRDASYEAVEKQANMGSGHDHNQDPSTLRTVAVSATRMTSESLRCSDWLCKGLPADLTAVYRVFKLRSAWQSVAI
jgi:hypothetical protein